MIQVQNLTKKFGDRTAVDGISFHVKKGEIVGLLGPNGAGKTTTMRMLTCFLPPDEGEATLCGHSILENPFEVKNNLGYLPEYPPIYEEYLVEPYLHFICQIKNVAKKQRKQAVDLVLEKCGLTSVRKRLIANLSRGYKQRVGLAQALVHDPRILILDEPTLGLDPNQIREIRALIKGLAGDHTVVLSTHILPEVSATCDRVIVIHEGKIVASDTHENLLKTHGGSLEDIFAKLTAGGNAP
ncbi:MAG: ATP-binding cassette domain-containing protein [Deltaproteobacteria bacterium]|nr:ATP-binding cassette domain-containing protein [Deltaproteobacteria bacterium]